MKKLKIFTVVGTRPEIIRLSRVIFKLNQYCDHILVHTGQNYDFELNQIFFEDLEIKKPDFFLNSADHANGPSSTIGNIISSIDQVFETVNPDAVLILGDTNSSLSCIAAKKRKIPIFHMEAGNRCFDQRVPEEINRKIVDHTADINLTYSSIAKEYLIREGLPNDLIIKTGSPMFEVLNFYMRNFLESNILNTLNLRKHEFFLVSIHREENIESTKNLIALVDILNYLGEEYKIPVIVSTHPRTRKKLIFENYKLNLNINLLKPMGFFDYIRLQMESKCVLSDSGTISEESAILNFPALNLRESHERPEAMEEASVMMVGVSIDRVKQSLNILAKQKRGVNREIQIPIDYTSPNVSEKVVRIIHSYTDYINRVIWKKY